MAAAGSEPTGGAADYEQWRGGTAGSYGGFSCKLSNTCQVRTKGRNYQ